MPMPNCYRFSQAEKEQFEEQGYVVREREYSPAEMDAIGDRVDVLIQQVRESAVLSQEQKEGIIRSNELSEEELARDGQQANVHSVVRIHLFSQMIREHIRDRRKLDVAIDLLGEDLFCPNDLYFYKPPGIGRPVCWHQDSWYFLNSYESSVGDNIDDATLGTWLGIDDSDRNNGCLWVIPGSHKRGVVEHNHVEKTFLKYEATIAAELECDAIPVEVPRGSLIFFNNALLHCSTPNQSENSRRAYVVHYMKASVRHTERGRNQTNITRLKVGIPEGYVCGRRLTGCVWTPDDEDCLNWDDAIGRPMTVEDLALSRVAGSAPRS